MKKVVKGLVALGLCVAMAAVPMVAHADPAPLDAAGAEVENANKDAVTITVKQTVPRVDYVSNVVYKQINTPNSHQSLVLNLLLPKLKDDAPAPVVMFVKGSGFTAMNLDGFMQQRMYLAQKGFAVIEVETRVVPQATFPAQTIDLKAAIRFVRAHAKEFNLNVDKIGVWGDSSGGWAATVAATSNGVKDFEEGENLDFSSDIAACVDFYGPTDLQTIGKGQGKDIEKGHDSSSTTEAMLVNGTAFGTNPGGSINSDPEKAKKANPITYIDKKDPAFLIFHGTNDNLVSVYESQILYENLKKAGVPAKLVYVKDGTHGGVDFYQPEIMDMVADFFEEQLK